MVKRNGWKAYYVGLKDKKEIKAASLILAKEIPVIKKKMFYAPRGFLIDYHDLELLTTFTREIKIWAKEKKGIFHLQMRNFTKMIKLLFPVITWYDITREQKIPVSI